MAAQDGDHLSSELEGALFKGDDASAGRQVQDKAKVDMDDVSCIADHYVSIVSIPDRQQIGYEGVCGQGANKVQPCLGKGVGGG